jgi:hypothetical protein
VAARAAASSSCSVVSAIAAVVAASRAVVPRPNVAVVLLPSPPAVLRPMRLLLVAKLRRHPQRPRPIGGFPRLSNESSPVVGLISASLRNTPRLEITHEDNDGQLAGPLGERPGFVFIPNARLSPTRRSNERWTASTDTRLARLVRRDLL